MAEVVEPLLIEHVPLEKSSKERFVAPVVSFVFLLVQLGLLIWLEIESKNLVYTLFFLFWGFDMIYWLLAIVKCRSWTDDDFYPFNELSFDGCFSLCDRGDDPKLHVTRWRVVKLLCWVGSVLWWLIPLWYYGQVTGQNFGLGISYAGKSSCTRISTDEFSVYNPYGAFPNNGMLRFSESDYHVQCLFDDVTWAYPNPVDNKVQLYNYISGTRTISCNLPVFAGDGYVALSQCNSAEYPGYPDPSLGVRGPVVEGTTGSSIDDCPGNKNPRITCYNTQNEIIDCSTGDVSMILRRGTPYKLCPLCLNDYRKMANFPEAGEGYEHCPQYNPGAPSYYYCSFCMGYGFGPLADAVGTTQSIIIQFWLATAFALFTPFVEQVVYLVLLVRIYTIQSKYK